MPDLDMMSRLFKRIQELYEADPTAPNREAITLLDWPYGDEVDPDFVAREINGYALVGGTIPKTSGGFYGQGELIEWFGDLQPDGRTSSGNWLFCGQYNTAKPTDKDKYPDLITVVNGFQSINKARKRDNVDTSLVGATGETAGLYSNWSWCWPYNRRIIYNRAAVDLNGEPWDAEHPVLRWNGATWVGDIVDGGGKPINLATAVGTDTKNLPFIMNTEGVGKLWGYGLKDGPIPEVYEPWESPLAANPLSGVPKGQLGFNDSAAYIGTLEFDSKNWNQRGTVEEFPYVATTYRCTEHWQTGIMTRNLPWLAELMPEMYVELGEDLADSLEPKIKSGDRVNVSSARGTIEALAVVTKRFQAITVEGKTIHQVGIPWHWGYAGRVTGDSGNVLTPHVGDANTSIPEYKTFLCKVEKA
jgi:formate dehydrogenase major subunit